MFLLLEQFFSSCIVFAVAKENLLKTPAIVSLANFQPIQLAKSKARIWLAICEFLCLLINQNVWFVTLFALNEPSSALNYLKTAFILTNQNWVIFSCILLAHKTQAIVYAIPAVTWYHYFPYRSAAQKTEQHSITTSPDFPSNKKFNFPLYHKRNQEIFVQGRRLFNTLTSWNFHGILPPLSKENFKQK